MLKLIDIKKDYAVDKEVSVHALKCINTEFPDTGFISILGPSGCGKTTLLNILGGLDRYTSGDLVVDGKSTKDFTDHDWDNYRNKKIGMVFQSYNLISHMTVLGNVEVALTLSGVERSQRKNIAIEALKAVGLDEQIHKFPSQLSGGQMQRVALARAIINNPSVILADEPTGALDSVTSIQIMDILKKIAATRLVIMVTHNKSLALAYSSRIIEIKDGEIIKDYKNRASGLLKYTLQKNIQKSQEDEKTTEGTDNAKFGAETNEDLKKAKVRKKKSSMSFFTAISISLQSIRSKKGRTALTSIAGSFGIIGVALVLSLSNGFNIYISNMQSESLAQFPISIEGYSTEYSENPYADQKVAYPDDHSVVVNQPVTASLHVNDISDEYTSYLNSMNKEYYSSINYSYALRTNVLSSDTSGKISVLTTDSKSFLESYASSLTDSSSSYWYQLPANDDFVLSKYDLIEGTYPQNENEAVLVVDKYNGLAKAILSKLGFDVTQPTIDVTTICNKEFKLLSNDEYYTKSDYTADVTGRFLKSDVKNLSKLIEYLSSALSDASSGDKEALTQDNEKIESFFNTEKETKTLNFYSLPTYTELKNKFNDSSLGSTIKVVGILRPNKTSVTSVLSNGIYCKADMVESAIKVNSSSSISTNYQDHIVLGDKSLLYGFSIPSAYYALKTSFNEVDNPSGIDTTSSSALSTYINQRKLFGTDVTISSITIYPKDFTTKKNVLNYLDAYNANKETANQIKYTDLAGTVFSSLETLVNMISAVLIAFASISLVVSSIMIGIIIYNSVIERTKEIGILRAIGARKKDVSRLFKAEACIIGFISGVFGVCLTYILTYPLNAIFNHLSLGLDLSHLAQLNIYHAIGLVALSVVLNYIASLIPARMASKKDPVIALRTE